MLNLVKFLTAGAGAIGRKLLTALLLAFLLFSSLLNSQSNIFKLGFTGSWSHFALQISY